MAGNFQYTGAPALACLAALRAGVDVVTCASPRRAAGITATFSPSIITYPLEGDFLMEKHLAILFNLAQKKDAVALGPGLGREEETFEVVRKLVARVDVPVIVDADGIYAFAQSQKYNPKFKSGKIIFTPHIRELEVLYGRKISDESLESKTKIARETAQKLGAIVLLKGPTDIITDGAEVVLNKTGSPYMTSGGTGDVLAGIAGALAAQLHVRGERDYFKAATCAAYLSGRAGEMAAKKYKDSLVATDVIEKISTVIKKTSDNHSRA